MMNSKNHLEKLASWNEAIDKKNALKRDIYLTNEHIEILMEARLFFNDYGFSPSIRPLCKYIARDLGNHKASGIYLNKLFQGSPAKEISFLAGLPKPKNCI